MKTLLWGWCVVRQQEVLPSDARKVLSFGRIISAKHSASVLLFFVCTAHCPANDRMPEAAAQEADVAAERLPPHRRRYPYECPEEAGRAPQTEIAERVRALKAASNPGAIWECYLAELQKRVGNPDAESSYRKTLSLAPTEPAYELLYGSYVRDYRGAKGGLTFEVENAYQSGLEKLQELKNQNQLKWFDEQTETYLKRNVMALHQYDGIPVVHRAANDAGHRIPLLFFGNSNLYQSSTSAFARYDEIRDWTSASQFAQSDSRLGRLLTREERRRMIRERLQFESLSRIRIRHEELPVVDFFYRKFNEEDGAISSFFEPTRFNDVKAEEFGLSLSRVFRLNRFVDARLNVSYENRELEGAIEFFPESEEDTDRYSGDLALSGYLGPDRITVGGGYAFEKVKPGLEDSRRRIYTADAQYDTPRFGPGRLVLRFRHGNQSVDPGLKFRTDRDRLSYAGSVRYIFLAKEYVVFGRRFPTAGIDVFAGVARDEETFSEARILRKDFNGGITIRRLQAVNGLNPFDVSLQSVIFESEVENSRQQDNAQLSTELLVRYRLKDEQHLQRVADSNFAVQPSFIHLLVPVRYEHALDGPDSYENFRIGMKMEAELFASGEAVLGPMMTVALGYDFQRFHEIDKNVHLFLMQFKVGF